MEKKLRLEMHEAGGQYREEYESVSRSPYFILLQIRLEPILQKKALELNREGICYSSEVIDVEEQEDGVVLTVTRKDGSQSKTKTSYVIGADGGRNLTDKFWAFLGKANETSSTWSRGHFQAPISLHHPIKVSLSRGSSTQP